MKIKLLNIKDITEEDINKVAKYLPNRYVKANKYSSHEDFLRCIGVGVLLIQTYPGIMESNIEYNEHGKPVFNNGEYFNASHSGNYVVLVQGQDEIGIDIEQMDGAHLKMVDKICSSEELEWVNIDPLRRFYTIWTMKESLLKAAGIGLVTRLNLINVLPFTKSELVEYQDKTYYNQTIRYENYYISVTSRKPIDNLQIE